MVKFSFTHVTYSVPLDSEYMTHTTYMGSLWSLSRRSIVNLMRDPWLLLSHNVIAVALGRKFPLFFGL